MFKRNSRPNTICVVAVFEGGRERRVTIGRKAWERGEVRSAVHERLSLDDRLELVGVLHSGRWVD